MNFDSTGKIKNSIEIKIEGKSRQNVENKQTFELTEKFEIEGKTRQHAENKQTLDLKEKIGIEGKTRQTIGTNLT